MFEPKQKLFAVVTHFTPEDGKRPIVHSWGPYATRAEATSAKGKMQREHNRRADRPGEVTYHVGAMARHDDSPITIADSSQGDMQTHLRCTEVESGGVQCDLRKGHLEAGVWHWIAEANPEMPKNEWAFYRELRP